MRPTTGLLMRPQWGAAAATSGRRGCGGPFDKWAREREGCLRLGMMCCVLRRTLHCLSVIAVGRCVDQQHRIHSLSSRNSRPPPPHRQTLIISIDVPVTPFSGQPHAKVNTRRALDALWHFSSTVIVAARWIGLCIIVLLPADSSRLLTFPFDAHVKIWFLAKFTSSNCVS